MENAKIAKRNRIIYWIFTVWLALGMISTALVQLLNQQAEVENFTHLGYPLYLMTLLGVWKILGSVAVLVPRLPLLKEWAYAGFVFAMTGAAISHVVTGNTIGQIFPSLLLLTITLISWYFRPANRKLVAIH